MPRYDRVTYVGKTFDRMTVAALHATIKQMGCPYGLDAAQGSYNSSVGASAGTHDGGGAVDLLAYQAERKCKAGRKVGWAMWIRPAIPRLWNKHLHGILIGNARAASDAKAQVLSYRNHRDGLAGQGYDSFWRPKPIRGFNYRKPLVSRRRLNRILRHKGGRTRNREGIRQVELVYIALQGFNFDMRDHRRGHYDDTMRDAIKRLQRLKFGSASKHGTVGPKTLAALCIPSEKGRGKRRSRRRDSESDDF